MTEVCNIPRLWSKESIFKPEVTVFNPPIVNIFKLMIDRRHPDGSLRVLINNVNLKFVYPSLSFLFFDFKCLFFAHVYENANIYGVILVMSRQLVYSVTTRRERIDILVFG